MRERGYECDDSQVVGGQSDRVVTELTYILEHAVVLIGSPSVASSRMTGQDSCVTF